MPSQRIWKVTMAMVVIVMGWITVTSADIFTSSVKVERMVNEEERLLRDINRMLNTDIDRLKTLTEVYEARLEEVRKCRMNHDLPTDRSTSNLSHPNVVYNAIKHFADDYFSVFQDKHESLLQQLRETSYVTDHSDVMGARRSLLRLQDVYNLEPLYMARGDYLGHHGPPLMLEDVFGIGQLAFSDNAATVDQIISWLNVSLNMIKVTPVEEHYYTDYIKTLSDDGFTKQRWLNTEGNIKALIGRVLVYHKDVAKATKLYEEAKALDPTSMELIQLEIELRDQPFVQNLQQTEVQKNFTRLCQIENKLHTPFRDDPRVVCRYRPALLPYYRFQEEILSVSPFASVLYDVITDDENDALRDNVKDKLSRAQVTGGDEHRETTKDRICAVSWVHDQHSPIARGLSQRVSAITGLTTQAERERHSAEAFQVANYGLGGHYYVHMDPIEDKSTFGDNLKYSGNRIATFMIYLSTVERGGATVFTKAGIAVPPIKNMALMWYNYNPAHELDTMTEHGGCPVLVGHKWIANKWILEEGNVFRRRCGTSRDVTELDIEPDMRGRYGATSTE